LLAWGPQQFTAYAQLREHAHIAITFHQDQAAKD